MRRIRIVTTGALVAAVLGTAIAGAAAQSATQPTGSPLPLLQFSHPKSTPKPLAHRKIAARVERKPVVKRRLARRPVAAPPRAVAAAPQTPDPAAAADALPANMWPAAGTVTPDTTGTLAPPQATPPVSTASVVESNPNEIISDGHAVQVTSPDQINAADLAADNHERTASEQTPHAAVAADPIGAAPVTAVVARAAVEKPETPSPVGSASWIAQVLAALGGAVTAGIVAWFLIRPAPIRMYG